MSRGKPEPGTRVAVLNEGFYVGATLESVRNDSQGNEYITVRFDDDDKREYSASEVVGNGFKDIHDIKLRQDQKIYAIFSGKEVLCDVIAHTGGLVKLKLPEEYAGHSPIVKLDHEVSLTKHRHSPRPQDYGHEPDYRKIASINSSPNHGKKMPVSANIEVPHTSRTRKSSDEPVMDELMAAMILSELSSSPVFYNRKGISPHSFGSSGVGSWGRENQLSPPEKDSFLRSSLGTPERSKSVIQHTQSIEHSPSSTGDPIEVDSFGGRDTDMPLEDDESFSTRGNVVPPGHSTPAPFHNGSPGLQEYKSAASSSPSQNPSHLGNPGIKLEAVEEEPIGKEDRPHSVPTYNPSFYFIPSLPHIMRSGDYMAYMQQAKKPSPHIAPADKHTEPANPFQHQTQFNADARVSSPSSQYLYIGAPPNIQAFPVRTNSPFTLLQGGFSHGTDPVAYTDNKHFTGTLPMRIPGSTLNTPAQPINIPGIKPFSWHTARPAQSLSPKPSLMRGRQQLHQATSPKMGFHGGRKYRGDGKKCRKIYGMENRDRWCTACRWKKACQRFPD